MICDAPDTFSRWMLEQTALLLEVQGAPTARLQDALTATPLAKPEGHKGPASTDMFRLVLAADDARRVRDFVSRAAEQGLTTPATRERGLGGFEAAWGEYLAFLDQGEARLAALADDRLMNGATRQEG